MFGVLATITVTVFHERVMSQQNVCLFHFFSCFERSKVAKGAKFGKKFLHKHTRTQKITLFHTCSISITIAIARFAFAALGLGMV